MKLAIDASRANRKHKTGVEWYAFYVIQEIIKNLSSEDTLILYFQDDPNGEWGSFPDNVIVKVLRWPPKFLWTHIRLGVQSFIDQPEILFIPAHVIPLFSYGTAVMTLHDVAFHYFKESYSWHQNLYQKFAIWYAKNFSQHVISPTQITKQDLVRFFQFPKQKITVISHGVDVSLYENNSKEASNLKTQAAEMYGNYILYVGRIETKKNIIRMIQAFEAYKKTDESDLQFVLVGKPGFGYDEITDYISQSTYKDNITLLGWVSVEQLVQLYQQAQCFLYVTLYEGFGMPIYEAFAAQVPVITSNQGASLEIVQDFGVAVSPLLVEEISEALRQILDLEIISQAKIKQAADFVHGETWQKCGTSTYQLLKNQLNS